MKQLLITIAAVVLVGCGRPNQPTSIPLDKFWFNYDGPQEKGFRFWERDADGMWTETYPSGHQSLFKEEGKVHVNGLSGIYVTKLKGDIEKTGTLDGGFRVFIPDNHMKDLFLYFSNKTEGNWNNWFKSKNSSKLNVLKTRDGEIYENIPKEIKKVLEQLKAAGN